MEGLFKCDTKPQKRLLNFDYIKNLPSQTKQKAIHKRQNTENNTIYTHTC